MEKREMDLVLIEADKRLLVFNTYEEYLDSVAEPSDLCYLSKREMARMIAELGFMSGEDVMSREEFFRRRKAVDKYVNPSFTPYELASELMKPVNTLLTELALRERINRLGIVSTILFLRTFTDRNVEISGYIDYADRLKHEDWKPLFSGKKKLEPRRTDLGFYNWQKGEVQSNDSENFKVLYDPEIGVMFQNRYDRKPIIVDPCGAFYGTNTTRFVLTQAVPGYEQIVLYDHVVLQRV